MRRLQSTRLVVRVVLLFVLVAGAGAIPGAQAAPPAQAGTLSLTDPIPATGTLDPTVSEAVYQFECTAGGVASVRVETLSGDLVVDILVQTADGATLAQGGQVSSNPNVSVAELFAMETAGTCSVVLAQSGDTSGEYAVWLLPGYAAISKFDTFDDPGDPLQMVWEPYASESMTVATIGQQLQIQVFTDNLLGYAVPSGDDLNWSDFYMQAEFEIVGSPSYAEYGFVMRLDDNVDLFYALTFSSDGDWSLYWFDGEWTAIQDWTASPAIDVGESKPVIGVWAQGNTFRAYFNGSFVGEAVDSSRYESQGGLGVVAATGVDQADPLAVYVDNVVVTTPAESPATGLPFGGMGGDSSKPTATPAGLLGMLGATKPPSQAQPPATPVPPPALPTATPKPVQPPATQPPAAAALQLGMWNSGSPKQIVAELRDLNLVPPGGALSLTVPSSYGDTSSGGFSFYPLGQGRTFRDFVLAFDARLVNTGPESGCGIFFRDSSTSSYDALVFEDGSFLLGAWDAQGNLLDSSIYEFHEAVIPGQGATNTVLVVANGGSVTMFVNGELVADAAFAPASGGLALEMYVSEDEFGATVQTYCQLNDIWLWEF